MYIYLLILDLLWNKNQDQALKENKFSTEYVINIEKLHKEKGISNVIDRKMLVGLSFFD